MSSLHRLSPEAYRTILENLPGAVYLVDLERRISFWNDGCERITGYRRQEVIGRCCADDLLMHCDETSDCLCGSGCPLLATMHDGRAREADLFLRHKEGHRVPVRVRAVPVRAEDRSIIGASECFEERPLQLPRRPRPHLVPVAGALGAAGLPGEAAFLRQLAGEFHQRQAWRTGLGIICFGIDQLEHVTASEGASAVARLLHATGRTLAQCAGPDALLGCLPDGLLLLALHGCTEAALRESAALLRRLAGLEAVPWWGTRVTVAWSAGATLARAEDTPQDFVRRAREALQHSLPPGGQVVVI